MTSPHSELRSSFLLSLFDQSSIKRYLKTCKNANPENVECAKEKNFLIDFATDCIQKKFIDDKIKAKCSKALIQINGQSKQGSRHKGKHSKNMRRSRKSRRK